MPTLTDEQKAKLVADLNIAKAFINYYWDRLRLIEDLIGFDIDTADLNTYIADGSFEKPEDAQAFVDQFSEEDAEDEEESDTCSACGGTLDDGDGYDGLCGSCADQEDEEFEEETRAFERSRT